nr:MAG: RNA-dependent RNA polymerase [Jingmen bat jingchuvirus 1]
MQKFSASASRSTNDLDPIFTIQTYNRRFSTAIDLSLCRTWCNEYRDDLEAYIHEKYNLTINVREPMFDSVARFLLICLSPNASHCSNFRITQIALQHAQDAINEQINWINTRVQVPHQLEPQRLRIPSQIATYCEHLFYQGMKLDNHMLSLQKRLSKGEDLKQSDWTLSLPNVEIRLLGKFILVHVDTFYEIFPAYILSLVIGKCIELGACLLSLSQTRRDDRLQFINNLYHFLSWVHDVIDQYGNHGYTLLKSLDGIGHGILTRDLDEGGLDYLLNNITKDLHENGFDIGVIQRGVALISKFPFFDIPNVTGLAKIFGYPAIDTSLGLKQLYTRTHKEIPISQEAVKRVINMAKLLFLQNYWRKHKRYPVVLMNEKVPRNLARALLSGRSFASKEFIQQYGKVSPGDFDAVQLVECVPFDWFDRFYPLLKDKAAAPRRSAMNKFFANEVERIPSSQRVLLSYLRASDLSYNWKAFRYKFSRNPRIVDDELVIKLTSKEKELKVMGRMFGQSPILERHRRIVGEMNIAYLMEEYNNDQAMMINEHDKRRKMAFLSRASVYAPSCYSIIIGVDAEAWNNYFRSDLVDAFGEEFFDRIFGINFYRYTMSVFNLGLIYHRDATDQIIYWNGQDGGIEGLAQKVWTWIYTVIARLVLHLMDLEGFLMVNGDDMRMVVLVPKTRVETTGISLQEYQSTLLLRLKDLFQTYGIIVKTDETNMTRALLCFGRNYVYSGINFPGDMKKIIKAGGLTDVGFPSITDVIASITSNTHSACGLSYQIIPHVTFAYTLILLYLHWHRFITLTHTSDSTVPYARHEDTTMLLTVPNSLGGIDTLLLYQFIIQGESDPLPLALDWLMYLWHQRPSFKPAIRRVLSVPISPTIPRGLLMTDIYALPLDRPPRPLAVVAARVRKHIPRICRNTELRKLLQYDQTERSRVINALWSMDPFNPRIASYLYSLSPCALLDSILQKFDAAPTLSAVLFRNDRQKNFKLYSMVIAADRKLIGSVIRRFFQGDHVITPLTVKCEMWFDMRLCATTQAISLRQMLWRKPGMVDSTIPSVLQQMMIVQEKTIDPSIQTFDSSSPLLDHFTGRTVVLTHDDKMYGPLCKLLSAPYFAHTTGLRLGSRLTDLKGNEPMISMIKKLTDAQALLSDQGGDLQEWANWCSLSLFGDDIKTVCPSVVKKLGGTVGHRLPAWSFIRTVYLNTLPSRSGRCRTNLDTVAQKTGIFGKNRTHNYSAMTCWFQYHCTVDMENDLLSNGYESLKWAILVNCRTKAGDPSYCSCHKVIENIEYKVAHPPELLTTRIERLINSCELTKMPEESQTTLDEYKRRFSELWFGPCEYDAWLDGEVTVDKYNLASMSASLIICSELQSGSNMSPSAAPLADMITFQTVIGRSSGFANISARDLASISMDHLAVAFVQTCLNLVIDALHPSLGMSSSNWVRMMLPPGVFIDLCHSLSITKMHGRFCRALNTYLHSLETMGIPITYDLLSTPSLLARALSRVIVDVVYNMIAVSTNIPISLLVFLPGLETDTTIKVKFLSHLWRIIILSMIKGRRSHNLTIPSKSLPIESMTLEMYRSYLAACFMMTQAFMETGEALCSGYLRQVLITPQSWLHAYPSNIVTWDPLQPYIPTTQLTKRVFTRLIDDVTLIIDSCFLRTARYEITITRLPFKLCVDLCQEWMNTYVLIQDPPPPDTEYAPVEPPLVTRKYSALPLDCDTFLASYNLPKFPFEPIPWQERRIFNPAVFMRYYALSTTALNKYLEVLLSMRNLRRLLQMNVSIISTADGSGGVAVLMTRLFENARVVFNTLEDDPSRRTELVDCPDEAYLDVGESGRIMCGHNASGCNDLSEDLTIRKYITLSKNTYGKYWCLTCDAEAPNLERSEKDAQMVHNLIVLCNEAVADGGVVIIKRFISPAIHQLKLYLYLSSSFSHVNIIKPVTSNISSGEVFFVGFNKVRSWPSDLVEEFWKSPRSTLEPFTDYFGIMNALAAQRLNPNTRIKMSTYPTPHSVPIYIQRKLCQWRMNYKRLCDQCRYLPRTWVVNDEIKASKEDVDSFYADHLKRYPAGVLQLSKQVTRGFMMTIGACVVLASYLNGDTFEECDEKRVVSEEYISANAPSTLLEPVKIMHQRHIRVGGKMTLAMLGAIKNNILLKTDDDDIMNDEI